MIRVRVEGVEAVQGYLEKAAEGLGPALAGAVARGVEKIRADAQALAPMDTGSMSESIQTAVNSQGGNVTGTVSVASGYAAYVEMGTQHMAARPFLYPAASMNQAEIAGDIAAAVRECL